MLSTCGFLPTAGSPGVPAVERRSVRRAAASGQNQTEESEPSSEVARVFVYPAGSKRLILSVRRFK